MRLRSPARALVIALLGALGAACAHSDASSSLRIQVAEPDRDAEVFVDGNYVGQVKALEVKSTGPLLLAPGVHRVEVRKPGRFPVQRTVEVDRKAPPPEIVVDAELLEDPQP
ncbi:MAG: hypothetical protein R3B09_30370 [Nannocystaceae bacterium]